MMKISFLIPVYNCGSYLPACVESIRAVGAANYEILLINDGSTDGSREVCDALAAQYPQIRVIHQANAGASAARNRALEEARGELLLFLDADDSIDADALCRILSDPRCGENDLTIFGLTFDYYHKGECYRRDPLYFAFEGILDPVGWGESFVQLFRDNALSPVWNKVYKREIICAHGLTLNTSMFLYEDFEFVLRYMQHCDRIWNVPQAVYHYRQSEDEGNAGRRLMRIDSIPEFLRPIEASLGALPETVSQENRAAVLQQLYLTLAREKIAVSDLNGIRKVCREYRTWSENRQLPLEKDVFQQCLLENKAYRLYLRKTKSKLRHWLAVRVKAMLKRG